MAAERAARAPRALPATRPTTISVEFAPARRRTAAAAAAQERLTFPARSQPLVTGLLHALQLELGDAAEAWVGDSAELAKIVERFRRALPTDTRSAWDGLIGPFYTAESVQSVLGVTRQRVFALRRGRQLVSVTAGDGAILYPAFQFDAGGTRLPRLAEVLATLSEAIDDEWARALWLNTPVQAEAGRTPAGLLRASTDDPALAEAVLALAAEDKARRAA